MKLSSLRTLVMIHFLVFLFLNLRCDKSKYRKKNKASPSTDTHVSSDMEQVSLGEVSSGERKLFSHRMLLMSNMSVNFQIT